MLPPLFLMVEAVVVEVPPAVLFLLLLNSVGEAAEVRGILTSNAAHSRL